LALIFGKIGSIAHQAASLGGRAKEIHGRHGMTCRKTNKLIIAIVEQCVAADQERTSPLLPDCRECHSKFIWTGRTHDQQAHPKDACRSLEFLCFIPPPYRVESE